MPRNADGSSSYNMFGIKAGEGWAGPRRLPTRWRSAMGSRRPNARAFRSYGSIEESVNDFAALLKNSPRLQGGAGSRPGRAAYVARIGNSGYATDPDYGNKLNEILHGDALQSALAPRVAKL